MHLMKFNKAKIDSQTEKHDKIKYQYYDFPKYTKIAIRLNDLYSIEVGPNFTK